jgi:tryptophan-rich sensory protein
MEVPKLASHHESLNVAWSQLFFGLRQPVPALVDIVGLLGTVVALTVRNSFGQLHEEL